MTDNEIIKALECCFTNEDCSLCPLFRKCPTSFKLEQYALDLINRQQAEIDRLQLEKEKLEIELKSKAEALNKSINSAMEVIKKQDAEIESLQKVNDSFTDIGKLYSEIKAETIKEFIEKYIKELIDTYDLKGVQIDNVNRIAYNLAKEMVGEG